MSSVCGPESNDTKVPKYVAPLRRVGRTLAFWSKTCEPMIDPRSAANESESGRRGLPIGRHVAAGKAGRLDRVPRMVEDELEILEDLVAFALFLGISLRKNCYYSTLNYTLFIYSILLCAWVLIFVEVRSNATVAILRAGFAGHFVVVVDDAVSQKNSNL